MAAKVKPLDITTRPIAHDWLEIQIEGEMDLTSSDLLRERLEEPLTARESLSLNLQACEFIDCAALAEIVRAQRQMKEVGQMLCVSSMSPAARRLFDLTGLLVTDLVREPSKAL